MIVTSSIYMITDHIPDRQHSTETNFKGKHSKRTLQDVDTQSLTKNKTISAYSKKNTVNIYYLSRT